MNKEKKHSQEFDKRIRDVVEKIKNADATASSFSFDRFKEKRSVRA